jgi:hypothetical protein
VPITGTRYTWKDLDGTTANQADFIARDMVILAER